MKLLLKEDVDGLGFCGDEVEVKDGYGRNFLIPKDKALLATPNNLKAFNHQKRVVQGRLTKVIAAAQAVADEIAKVTCSVKKKVGDTGKMFGSVTAQEVSDLLKAQGVDVDRRKIQIADPIKKVGEYKIPVKLHSEVMAEIKLVVEGEQEAAPAPEVEQEAKQEGEGEAKK